MARTMHWLPKRWAPSAIRSGRARAAELTLVLSAPARSIRYISSVVRMPPPTVSGMWTRLAVARTTSTIVSRLSLVAVMSRKVISSAPAAS